MNMATASKELAVIEPASYAIMQADPAELQEALAVNAGGQKINPFDLDVVKIPAGGMTVWTVPDIEQGEVVKQALEGIIILQRSIRSWWAGSIEDTGGGSPPDCSSQDGLWGVGSPAGHPDMPTEEDAAHDAKFDVRYDENGTLITRGRFACEACPLAQFGSGKGGRGQACKQNRLLFLLTPDSSLPLVVKVPPSSLRAVQSFMLRLSGKGVPMYGCVVSLSLKKAQNGQGISYAEIVPSFMARLSPEETVRMKAVHESLRPILSAFETEADV
jgi:hypothetical protein